MRGARVGLGAFVAAVALEAWPALAWDWLKTPPAANMFDEEPTDVFDAPINTPSSSAAPEDGACLAAILAAEAQYEIPEHLLLALGLQEAGHRGPHGLTIWPWSVNAAGEGRRFNTPRDAMVFVQDKHRDGVTSTDVGCMQINLAWHPHAFASLSEAFDPAQNVDYAARFLLALYDETGDWWQAAGHYHSRSPAPQRTYLSQLRKNHAVALRQINSLRALAATSFGATDSAGFGFEDALPPPPNYRTEGAIWGAALAGEDGGRRTLYSDQDIEPILPFFLPPDA